MNIVEKIALKIKIEFKFLIEQKWGIFPPSDPNSISKSVIRKYLPQNPVIIDCGAHVGADSIELSKILPKSKIYSFEPVPTIFKSLKNATKKYSNIECFQIALSDKDGEAKFFVSSGESDASSSLMNPTGHIEIHPDVKFDKEIFVKTLSLDTWAKKMKLAKVDFLWLDMQGYELNMLKASNEIFKTVSVIHTEVSISNSYDGAVLYPEYRSWLESIGFKVVLEAIPQGTDMGNVLFVRE
jgi:FkbM family methyltransferase